jgi:hypothetical protein
MKIIQWTGINYNEVANFIGAENKTPNQDMSKFSIISNNGEEQIIEYNDYIIEGVDENYYPIKKEVLALFIELPHKQKITLH